ncbi:hypothetical protein MNBD_BACTEROID06-1259 [hydrothermal vent metagenome]|uniref:TonB C-terminal domain-containing protein n=1 Tax=hydrothermal vent metagenome TaxID=652676 RepID=A0A3B0UMH4_9ZZZZ
MNNSKQLFFIVLLHLSSSSFAQKNTDVINIACISESIQYNPNKGLLYDTEPKFIGGFSLFFENIYAQIKYPDLAKRMGVEGTVFVEFEVLKKGRINKKSISVIKSVGFDIDDEAIRLIRKKSKWIPATYKGENIDFKFIVPIKFKL